MTTEPVCSAPALLLHRTPAGRDAFAVRFSPIDVGSVKFNIQHSLIKMRLWFITIIIISTQTGTACKGTEKRLQKSLEIGFCTSKSITFEAV